MGGRKAFVGASVVSMSEVSVPEVEVFAERGALRGLVVEGGFVGGAVGVKGCDILVCAAS